MGTTQKSVEVREETFAGITLRMHFLDDGRRVIEATGMDAFIRKAEAGKIPRAEAMRAARWVKGDA